jgi:uncharacterized protein (DUF952 family)
VVLEVEADDLGEALRWEPSRGRRALPASLRPLDARHVRYVTEAPLARTGVRHGDLA